MGAILNPEVSDFHKIIGPRYVDKTELIAYTNSVMETDLKLICFSRPRRFGAVSKKNRTQNPNFPRLNPRLRGIR